MKKKWRVDSYNKEQEVKLTPIRENGDNLITVEGVHRNILVKNFHKENGIFGTPDNISIRGTVLEKLIEASYVLPSNLKFLVLDGWRPLKMQQALFHEETSRLAQTLVREPLEYLEYQATINVDRPSYDHYEPTPHNTGGVIDITLFDTETNEIVQMPTDYWGFNANLVYFKPTKQQQKDQNRAEYYANLLKTTLLKHDFVKAPLTDHWWEFEYGTQAWAFLKKKPYAIYEGVEID